jgi:hypothetical protein
MMTYSFTSQDDLDEILSMLPPTVQPPVRPRDNEEVCEGFCYRCSRPTNDFDEGGYYVCGAHS